MHPQGETNLQAAIDAVVAAVEQSHSKSATTHVVFLTDGVDSGEEGLTGEVSRLDELSATIRVFAIAETDMSDLRQLDSNAVSYTDLRELRIASSSLKTTAGIDFTERGLAGVKIFLDQNFNCLIDPGELVRTTQADDLTTPDSMKRGDTSSRICPGGRM